MEDINLMYNQDMFAVDDSVHTPLRRKQSAPPRIPQPQVTPVRQPPTQGIAQVTVQTNIGGTFRSLMYAMRNPGNAMGVWFDTSNTIMREIMNMPPPPDTVSVRMGTNINEVESYDVVKDLIFFPFNDSSFDKFMIKNQTVNVLLEPDYIDELKMFCRKFEMSGMTKKYAVRNFVYHVLNTND